MTDKLESLVLEQLRAIRADIALVKEDMREIKTLLALVGSGVAAGSRYAGDFATSIAAQHLSYDRLSDRVEDRVPRSGVTQ